MPWAAFYILHVHVHEAAHTLYIYTIIEILVGWGANFIIWGLARSHENFHPMIFFTIIQYTMCLHNPACTLTKGYQRSITQAHWGKVRLIHVHAPLVCHGEGASSKVWRHQCEAWTTCTTWNVICLFPMMSHIDLHHIYTCTHTIYVYKHIYNVHVHQNLSPLYLHVCSQNQFPQDHSKHTFINRLTALFTRTPEQRNAELNCVKNRVTGVLQKRGYS